MVRIKSKYDKEGFASHSIARKKHKLAVIVKKTGAMKDKPHTLY